MAETYDIVIVGAGTSGVVAALTAARLGARVALVEARTQVGGAAALGLHRFVCGLFRADGDGPGDPLHGPATLDFCARLAQGDVCGKAVRRGRVWVLPFAGGEALTACAREALAREARIRLYVSEAPARAVLDGQRLSEVVLASGTILRLRAAVDCTGRAALCGLAGCEVAEPGSPPLAGFGFRVSGIDERGVRAWGLPVEVPLLLRGEVDAGRLPPHLAFTAYEPGEEPGAAWIKLAVPSAELARARLDADLVFAALRSHPAFAQAALTAYVPEVLAREACHLRGQYVLTGEDVLSARKFKDGVVRNAWPVERWDAQRGVSYRYLPPGGWHDIPARCLRPERGPSNLLCAGTALSADSEAAASVRVMGVCMATGEAAARQSIKFL